MSGLTSIPYMSHCRLKRYSTLGKLGLEHSLRLPWWNHSLIEICYCDITAWRKLDQVMFPCPEWSHLWLLLALAKDTCVEHLHFKFNIQEYKRIKELKEDDCRGLKYKIFVSMFLFSTVMPKASSVFGLETPSPAVLPSVDELFFRKC